MTDRLEENVVVTLLVQNIASLVDVDALGEQLRLTCLGLFTGDAFFILRKANVFTLFSVEEFESIHRTHLDLLETIELLTLQLVQLGDDVGQRTLDARNNDYIGNNKGRF